jgi:hypothetical protein
MTPAEAERLLGGHAAGILTPEERRALYAAALKDQALFDALADEEALRALLADPQARAHLLAVLAPAESAPPKAPARPLWRRPSVLGLAASLFLLVTTRAVLRRTEGPLALQERRSEAKADAEKAAPDVQALAPARRDRLASEPQERQAPAAPPPPPPPMPASAPASLSAPAGAPSPTALQDAAPPAQELALAKRQKQEAEAKDQVRKASAEAKAAAPAREAVGVLGGVPGGVVGGVAAGAPAISIGGASAAENEFARGVSGFTQPSPNKQRAQAPTWTVTDLGQGRRRVRVRHGEGHLYLLQRSGDRVSLLKPLATEAQGASRTTDFEATLAPGDALDLYLLPTPAPKPEALPAIGTLAGFRARIHP